MPIFSVLRGVERAAVFVAFSVLVASNFVVELLVLHVQLFSRTVSFSVSRSSMLRSLLYNASPVISCGYFSPFFFSAPLPSQRLTLRSRGTPQKRAAP